MLLLLGIHVLGQNVVFVDATHAGLLLGLREIHGRTRTEDDIVALCCYLTWCIGHPGAPPGYGSGLRESTLQDFVPAHHLLTILINECLHLMDKPRLQFLLVLQMVILDALLTVGTFLPGILTHLVATYVYILIGEQLENLAPDILAEIQHLLFSGTEWGGKILAPADGGEARQTLVILDGTQEMTWHVNLGYNLDTALLGISHHVTNLILCVVTTIQGIAILYTGILLRNQQVGIVIAGSQLHADGVLVVVDTPGTLLGQQWVLLNLDTPALIVGQVPVESVQLVQRHQVDNLLHLVNCKEVA